MKTLDRRQFLGGALAAGGALTSAVAFTESLTQTPAKQPAGPDSPDTQPDERGERTPIDFRYAPALRQTAFCFPDDPYKSVMNENGDLLYGYDMENGILYFPLQFRFSLFGMQPAKVVDQMIESPSIPIVRTVLERTGALITLTTFATNDVREGRVDNVIMEIRPRGAEPVNVSPLVEIHTVHKCDLQIEGKDLIVVERDSNKLLFAATVFQNPSEGTVHGTIFDIDTPTKQQLALHRGVAASAAPYRAFFRFPQEGQAKEQVKGGLQFPEQNLNAARKFWGAWSPFRDPISMVVPGRSGEFVSACARNILQAREVKNGKLTFQVGPTCYRGLWVVDGNFLLEAARYLGYDKEAIEGLRTTWGKQLPSGQIVAGAPREHYKDTAIAMFTLVRQCELSQDWSLLHELEPNVVAGIQFLDSLRERARREGSALGGYGLLPRGFADGGFDGSREELTNTLWTLAGLKAICSAGRQQKLDEVAKAEQLFRELYAAFNEAAQREMRSYEGKFQYLPMLLKNDPAWSLPDPWDRPRPQCAQWALSHAIFPGRVFRPDDPIVKGHVALRQAVRREGVPAETGWSHHEAVWNYDVAFAAEVYLWLGMRQAARDTFVGFLNHATPQYCWREEQPLQDAMVGSYVGDMPHNWASAECIRYIRHVFALEDGADLRLLAGITDDECAAASSYLFRGTPTRFGRLDLNFEPLDGGQGWRFTYRRANGPDPSTVSAPTTIGRFKLARAEGVHVKQAGDTVCIDPSVHQWSLIWKV